MMQSTFNLFRGLLFCLLVALLQSGFAIASTLQPNADGTVTDPKTGLTWMRCAMGQTWDGSTCTGTASTYTFDQANALTGTVTFAGQSDWRLPNIRELQTVVDRSVSNPAIDSTAFPNTPSSLFWSGSPVASNSSGAWLVSFDSGYAVRGGRNGSLAVRLVRGGQSFGSLLSITRPTSDYVDNGNGTVTHTLTDLTWKRCAQGQTWTGSTCSGTASAYTFDQANVLTGTTTFAGQSDWRVPTETELVSLVDYGIAEPGPMINSSVFPATPGSEFWSGSHSARYSSLAWVVSFLDGRAYDYLRSSNYAVRLVRGGQSLGSLALTISKNGTGTGTVTSNPAGIDCGSTCSASFTSGASVTLTAAPTTGSTFTGWGGACTGTGSCTVSMTEAKSVTATFALSVTAPVCTLSANPSSINTGASATLTATCTPTATSYTWTGGTCAGTTGATCTVTPTATTTYTVAGANAGGAGTAASAVVTLTSSTGSSTLQPNADGTVFDPKTGLTWMRCAMGQTWTGSTCTGTVSTYTFDQANALAGTSFAGQSDWRMPNIRELQTIVDRSVYNPAIDRAAFPNTPNSGDGSAFWSGSTDANGSGNAWFVSFAYGGANGNRGTSFAVRLVRGGQSFATLLSLTRPTGDYVDNGNGTVTHTPTNLTWKRCAEGQTWTGSTCSGTASRFTYTEANALTGTVTFAGKSDWRTPTEDELVSLVDYTIAYPGPTINTSIFPNTPGPSFWSGSLDAGSSGDAWFVYFLYGSAGSEGRSSSNAVRLVRGGQSFGTFVLTISKSGAGTGTVGSAPAGISCGSTCSASFTSGASVTLTATPATGSTFTGWSGACTGTSSCTVSMTEAKSVTATFALSVTPPVCTLSASPATITTGSSSTLTATCTPAATSYTWTGGTCAGTTGATCTVTPTASTTYTVAGTNAGGAGAAASATVMVTPANGGISVASFAGHDLMDVWSAGSNVYVLASVRNASGSYYTDAGGVRAYQSSLYLMKITPDAQISEVKLGDIAPYGATSHPSGTLRVEGSTVYAFSNSKEENGTFSMSGYLYTADASTIRLTNTQTLFTAQNWGWYPVIQSGPAVSHFSFAGYMRYLGTSNLGSVQPQTMVDEWTADHATHAGGLVLRTEVSDMNGTYRSTIIDRIVAKFQQTAPVCNLSANPTSITTGASATLTATCNPAATSYTWTGGTCAGTAAATCTVTPTVTTSYSVAGTNAGGTGTAASATVSVNTSVSAPICTLSANPATINAGSSAALTATCTPAASSYTWTGGTCAGTTGATCTVTPTATTTYTVAGVNTGGTGTAASATVTIASASAPVCTLSANPASITAGGSSTLTATCNPTASSYIWTGGTCAGTSAATCTVKPTATTTYSVQGSNTSGTNQAASATVTVAASTVSYTVPGTLGNDVFVLTAGNSYYGGGGNDTFIISSNTLRGDVTAKIVDSEGDNLIQLVDGMTVTASSFYADAAQLTLSSGAKVQLLGASKFKFQVGANAPAGDTAVVLSYADFVSSLGASLTSGTLPALGTAGYVVPTGFTQASAPVPSVAGSSYTVPGTLGDDVFVLSGGNNYLGGGGNDTYIISPYTLSGAVTAKIIDSEGANVVQLVKGMTIASSSFFSNAVQLTFSNGAKVQILGASSFGYQLGANAPAGETASSLTYAQFAAALGASVPTGTSAVSGSVDFVVN